MISMYTQCPHCLTLFRISSEELKAAAGKVRCCQCTQVFNALETLQEGPVVQSNPIHTEQTETTAVPLSDPMTAEDSLFADTLNLDSDQLIELAAEEDSPPFDKSEESDELFLIRDDGLETEPDYLAAGSESQMSELLDSDSATLINTRNEQEIDAKIVSFNHHTDPDNPPRIELTEQSADNPVSTSDSAASAEDAAEKSLFRFTERQKGKQTPQASGSGIDIDAVFEKQHTSLSGFAWGSASLLLIVVMMLQLSWHYREQVIQYEHGQQFLTQLCRVAGCTAPERRDTSQIFIQHRDLRGHPGKSNALLLQLSMVNRAEFAQPYPKLHLSLFNDRDKLIADRTFEPLEYLSDSDQNSTLMPPSKPTFISMELADPGKDVTGFKFDFL